MTETGKIKEHVIPKEKAVFWMDKHGRWCNAHGPFEHAKIIQYFNASIGRDESGYFVAQECNGQREKVYFKYHITPLFALDLVAPPPPRLILNTGRMIEFYIQNLFIMGDQLYLDYGGEWIKFSERILLKLADQLKIENDVYFIQSEGDWHPIREVRQLPET